MSRPTTPQPETHGVTHRGQAPQVAVREGNRLLCPCCGQTLMVLKEKRFTPPKRHHTQGDPRRTWPSLERLIAEQEAHYQNGSKDEPRPQDPNREDNNEDRPAYRADSLVVPIDAKIAAHEFPPLDPPPFDPPEVPKPVKLPAEPLLQAKHRHQPPRDWNNQYEENQRRRSKRPLEDATSYEMARLYAWAYYRLQRLAVQIEQQIAAKQVEVDRLDEELTDAQEKPSSAQRNHRPAATTQCHAQADLAAALGRRYHNQQQEHAHASEGMAPKTVSMGQTTPAATTNQRGPP